MKIFIANDHGATDLKLELFEFLTKNGFDVENLGVDSSDSVDYPKIAEKMAEKILNTEDSLGILMCGTGIGISIAANKIKGIRAALCTNEYMAEMARRHNNANIISFGGRVVGPELAKSIVKKFLETEFDGGRHQRRVEQISNLENI